MGVIISFFNQKGGVAKTTSSVNVAAIIAKEQKKVLLVDMDSQASSTTCVGIQEDDLDITIFDLLKNKKTTIEDIQQVIIHTKFDNLDILPSNIELSNADIELSSYLNRESLLKKILDKIKNNYDYIIIDTPPNLGLLSVNSLVASHFLIIPVSPSFLSVKGIKNLLNTYTLIKENINPSLEILGVLITLFDSRKNMARDIRIQLSEVFNNQIFDTVIRVNSQIEYSQDSQTPLIYFNQKCNGFYDYMSVSKEIMNFVEGEKNDN